MSDIYSSGIYAGDTPIHLMTKEQWRQMVQPVKVKRNDKSITDDKLIIRSLPGPKLDWRNMDGKNFVTPIKTQVGMNGIGWSYTAAIESLVLRTHPTQYTQIDLSEHALVSLLPGYPNKIASFIKQMGIPPEDCYSSKHDDWDTCTPSPDWMLMAFRVKSSYYLQNPGVDLLKSTLVNYGPIVCSMYVLDDFFGWAPFNPAYNQNAGVYKHQATATRFGFHSVLLIGYNDAKRCFIAKNSWGTSWGDQGFFNISYDECNPPVSFGAQTEGFSDLVSPFPAQTTSIDIGLSKNKDGRLEIFPVGKAGGIFQAWQTTPNYDWEKWRTLMCYIRKAKQVEANLNSDGRLEVFSIDPDNRISHIWQTAANNGWSEWQVLHQDTFADSITSAINQNGRMEIFYVGTNEKLYHDWQDSAGENGWHGEEWLGRNDYAKKVVVARDATNRLNVFYIGTNNKLYHNWQKYPNAKDDWNGEEELDGTFTYYQLAAGRNKNSQLTVFYTGSTGTMYYKYQIASGWSARRSMGGLARQMAVEMNKKGGLEVFYIGYDYQIYNTKQSVPNGIWSEHRAMGGYGRKVKVIRNKDGWLEIFFLGADDMIYHNMQTPPTGDWTGPSYLKIAII